MISRACTVVVAALVAASAAGGAQRPVPKHYYLALGDSITYGFQPGKDSKPPSAVRTGYVDLFAAKLRVRNPKVEVVNYGCPGESTRSFTKGRCPWLADGRKLHDGFKETQLQAALAFLRAHKGQVSPITLTLFGNDVQDEFNPCGATTACIRSRGTKFVDSYAKRYDSILGELRAAAPTAEIVVTGAWNFDEERPELDAPLFVPLNKAMSRSAARHRARFADILPLFNPPGRAARAARLCKITFICSDDVHPTDAGYRVIADAVAGASRYTG